MLILQRNFLRRLGPDTKRTSTRSKINAVRTRPMVRSYPADDISRTDDRRPWLAAVAGIERRPFPHLRRGHPTRKSASGWEAQRGSENFDVIGQRVLTSQKKRFIHN